MSDVEPSTATTWPLRKPARQERDEGIIEREQRPLRRLAVGAHAGFDRTQGGAGGGQASSLRLHDHLPSGR